MARRANFIEEINSSKDTWKLKVQLRGLWCVERSVAPSLEMIFMDHTLILLLYFFCITYNNILMY
ncbi:hypothetical protein Lalb_Chr07g0177391 [Lupinus albus]|uniref:Uncharacterized protein n=1 Tax=Lupinus albus TaxID=3870 RepID=A0A6A4Q7R7_LUPAL|nr:hypothetical protein Lalb_Chr07g0177391 [Lupinus albus]